MKISVESLLSITKVLPEVAALIAAIKAAAADKHLTVQEVGAIGEALSALIVKLVGVVTVEGK